MVALVAAGHISDDEIIRALSKLLSQSTPGDKSSPSNTNAELRRRPLQRGEKTTINLRQQDERGVKQIGEDFSFKPRDQLDDEERRLMKDVELARQSRENLLLNKIYFVKEFKNFMEFQTLIGFNFKQNTRSQYAKMRKMQIDEMQASIIAFTNFAEFKIIPL